ncbi:MAG TPA: protein kinase [Polyangia bacterium]|nr:protein kinase [Polyangia bacterium]
MGVITRLGNSKSGQAGEAASGDASAVTPPPEVTDTVSVGQILENKYRVQRIVDEDRISITLAATHLKLDELVTIKVLSRQARAIPDVRARFAREAKTHARIRSEHAVQILDAGILPNVGPYMVTEYLDGRDLADLLKQDGPLSAHKATELMLQACDVVAVAHASGVVHGDLQPSNLFVARRGNQQLLKVLGFRVAKLGEEGPGQGEESSFEYLSPEQLREGATVDHRADIWALGMVLYEMVTGRSGFGMDTLQDSSVGRPSSGLPRVRLLPDAPPQLAYVIARCLARDPAARFQDVAELAAALAPFAPGPRTELYVERCTFTLQDAGFAVAVAGELKAKEPGVVPVSRSSDDLQTKIEIDPRLTAEAIAKRARQPLPPPSLAETAIAELMQTQPGLKVPETIDFDLRPRRSGLKFFGGAALSFLAVLGVRWVAQRAAAAPEAEVAAPAHVAAPPPVAKAQAPAPGAPLPSTEEHGLSTAPDHELGGRAGQADDGHRGEPSGAAARGTPGPRPPLSPRAPALALSPRPAHLPARAPATPTTGTRPAMRFTPHAAPTPMRRAAFIERSVSPTEVDEADVTPSEAEPPVEPERPRHRGLDDDGRVQLLE